MSRIFARFCLVAFALTGATLPTCSADPLPWEAHKWDLPLNLGPGGWHGVKAVVSEDKRKHQILPGAFVEGAVFEGKGGINWKVEGAFLKDCNFSGDLGFHFEAKDSAFEGCKLHKSGGWFVGWAGTKWRLTNCLITRSFLPKDIGLHDYSVRAVNCTFVGVEMPKMTHKNDPSTYVGKDDVKFENCLFVGCDITESVLAASVNSTFEGCHFRLDFERNPDKADKWDTAKNPVAVNARLVGEEPQGSHVHGQLSVNFMKAEPGATAGYAGPFVRAGARVVAPAWAAKITTFRNIGGVDKAASELPAVADAAAATAAATASLDTPPPPPTKTISGANAFLNLPGSAGSPAKPAPAATSPTPAPAAGKPASVTPPAPSDGVIRKLDDFLAQVPKGVSLSANGRLTADGMRQATQYFEQWGLGRAAGLRIAVEQSRPFVDDGYEFLVTAAPFPFRIQGASVNARIEAKFRSNQNAQRARMASKGAAVNVRGIIGKVAFVGTAIQPEIVFTLEDASLE